MTYIPKPYFKDVPGIGDLWLGQVILENGYPVLFTCNQGDRWFICLCRSVIDEQKWIISELSMDSLMCLLLGNIALYQAFKQESINTWIARWKKGDEEVRYERLCPRSLSDEELPPKHVDLDDI